MLLHCQSYSKLIIFIVQLSTPYLTSWEMGKRSVRYRYGTTVSVFFFVDFEKILFMIILFYYNIIYVYVRTDGRMQFFLTVCPTFQLDWTDTYHSFSFLGKFCFHLFFDKKKSEIFGNISYGFIV